MAKDGFTLLAMGYTGEKAMKFKLAYIKQFNAMEIHLSPKRTNFHIVPAKLADYLGITIEEVVENKEERK